MAEDHLLDHRSIMRKVLANSFLQIAILFFLAYLVGAQTPRLNEWGGTSYGFPFIWKSLLLSDLTLPGAPVFYVDASIFVLMLNVIILFAAFLIVRLILKRMIRKRF